MRTCAFALTAALAAAAAGCGATTTRDTTGFGTPPAITDATVTFMTGQDGKDEDSAIAVQLLDDDGRLVAEGTAVDVDYDDHSVSAPISLSRTGALGGNDLDSARVRLRLTPDGRDTWLFDMRLTVRLSDGTERQYFWSGLRLDENTPERVLTLQSGRMPRS